MTLDQIESLLRDVQGDDALIRIHATSVFSAALPVLCALPPRKLHERLVTWQVDVPDGLRLLLQAAAEHDNTATCFARAVLLNESFFIDRTGNVTDAVDEVLARALLSLPDEQRRWVLERPGVREARGWSPLPEEDQWPEGTPMPPGDTVAGVQARLSDAALRVGPLTGRWNLATRDALYRFQYQVEHPAPGTLDDRTLEWLGVDEAERARVRARGGLLLEDPEGPREQSLPGPILLREARGHGTWVCEDLRCGFSLLVPDGATEGAEPPRLAPGPAGEQPVWDALVQLHAPGLELRLRVDRLQQVSSLPEVAQALVGRLAAMRGAGPVLPWIAEPGRFPGVLAAAGVAYLAPGAGAAPQEDLLVLLGPGVAVTLLKRFAPGTEPLRLALTNAAINGSIQLGAEGDPERREAVALWPQSALQGPGLPGAVDPAWVARAAAALGTAPVPVAALRQRLGVLLRGSESPFAVIDDAMRTTYQTYLGDVCESPALRQLVSDGLAAVRTAHDLRGLALALDRGLSAC